MLVTTLIAVAGLIIFGIGHLVIDKIIPFIKLERPERLHTAWTDLMSLAFLALLIYFTFRDYV